jgi:hypothetical protein
VVHDPAKLVEFLKQAFDAKGDFRTDIPSVMRIGDSLVMVSGVGPRDAMPAFLYLYVDDINTTYERALKAGAVSLDEPGDMPSPLDGRRSMWQHLANRHANDDVSLDNIRQRTAGKPSR